MEKFTVPQLKDPLKKCDLSCRGLKADLIKRLLEAEGVGAEGGGRTEGGGAEGGEPGGGATEGGRKRKARGGGGVEPVALAVQCSRADGWVHVGSDNRHRMSRMVSTADWGRGQWTSMEHGVG